MLEQLCSDRHRLRGQGSRGPCACPRIITTYMSLGPRCRKTTEGSRIHSAFSAAV